MVTIRRTARTLKLTLKASKPRNPLVVAAILRKAGAHRKSAKALRRADNSAFRQLPISA